MQNYLSARNIFRRSRYRCKSFIINNLRNILGRFLLNGDNLESEGDFYHHEDAIGENQKKSEQEEGDGKRKSFYICIYLHKQKNGSNHEAHDGSIREENSVFHVSDTR